MRAALASPDKVIDRTISIIDRVVQAGDAYEQAIPEDESIAFSILLHICGELGDGRVHRPLLRLLADDADMVDWLLGDFVTGSVPGILISTYDGNAKPLLELIENPQAEQFCRSSALRAWTYLAAKDVWPKTQTENWLRLAFDTLQPKRHCHIWVSWLYAVATLGLDDLVPLANSVFEEDRLEEYNVFGTVMRALSQDEFHDILKECRNTADTDSMLRGVDLKPVDDTITEMSRWYCYSPKYREDQQRRKREAETERGVEMAVTVRNENRSVGRNAPCPCGSGRKYKKCCLHA